MQGILTGQIKGIALLLTALALFFHFLPSILAVLIEWVSLARGPVLRRPSTVSPVNQR